MIAESGRVVAVEAQAVWVETIRQSTCQSCSAQKACGHGLLSKLQSGRHVHIRALPGRYSLGDFAIGDQVRIAVPERVVVQGALLVYLLPLLTLLLGAYGAERLALYQAVSLSADLVAFLGAACGFGLGLVLVKTLSWRQRHDRALQPVVESLQKSAEPLTFLSELSPLGRSGASD